MTHYLLLDVETVSKMMSRPMTCCRCHADKPSEELNLCVECGEGFCDKCVPACKCGACGTSE